MGTGWGAGQAKGDSERGNIRAEKQECVFSLWAMVSRLRVGPLRGDPPLLRISVPPVPISITARFPHLQNLYAAMPFPKL